MKHEKAPVVNIFLLLAFLLVSHVHAQQPERSQITESPAEASRISLLVIGDWGTGGAGAKRVGSVMADEHQRLPVQAVISTGDNIYPSGVSSVDDPQWRSKFENIFPVDRLPIPFWAVLGNHDYRDNPDAQVTYTGHVLSDGSVTRWKMPGRYWTTVFHAVDGKNTLRVVGIDTQLLVGNRQTRVAHLSWLDSALTAATERRIFVVGHHPVYSHGHYGNNTTLIRHLAPLLEKHGVRAYLDGHEHDLQLIKPINGVRYIISGGGGGKRKTSSGKNTEFSSSSLGFVRIDLFDDRMRITYLDDRGKELYTATDTFLPEKD
ncbi:MAG: metallophosphoesterase [Bacteroidetes bacterium]|nr:metallophosphoesterase [Bacteroidota bacterium]